MPALIDEYRLSPAREAATRRQVAASLPALTLSVHEDLGAVETDWRAFEPHADCTVFQTYDWLATWHRNIGVRRPLTPAIVVARRSGGTILLIMPLAVERGLWRRLAWLGSELCDYNAPLLAPDFAEQVSREAFAELWRRVRALVQQRPGLRHDIVHLVKMPETVGAQINPFLALDVALNPSGAHLSRLVGTWEEFYAAKRSATTRRRERAKRKRLGEFGEVRFVDADDAAEAVRTLDILFEQKSRAFARMGVADIFAREGYREFFVELASNPRARHLVHVSRLEVGATCAAVNLGLTFRGRYHHVLASHGDGELARFGPGAAHLRELLRRAIELGFREFDFTIGDERYKFEWSDTATHLYDHTAATTMWGWPAASLLVLWRRVKRGLKQNPRLWQVVCRLRAAMARLARPLTYRAPGDRRLPEQPSGATPESH